MRKAELLHSRSLFCARRAQNVYPELSGIWERLADDWSLLSGIRRRLELDRRPSPSDRATSPQPYNLTTLPRAIAEGETWITQQLEHIERRLRDGFAVDIDERDLVQRKRIVWELRLLFSELKKVHRRGFN